MYALINVFFNFLFVGIHRYFKRIYLVKASPLRSLSLSLSPTSPFSGLGSAVAAAGLVRCSDASQRIQHDLLKGVRG